MVKQATIFVFIFVLSTNSLLASKPSDTKRKATVTLEDATDITWRELAEIQVTLINLGYTAIQINGFYAEFEPFIPSHSLPQPRSWDEIKAEPLSVKEDDFQALREWCQKTEIVNVTLLFGDQVKLKAIEQTTQILRDNGIKFNLITAGTKNDESISIKTWEK